METTKINFEEEFGKLKEENEKLRDKIRQFRERDDALATLIEKHEKQVEELEKKHEKVMKHIEHKQESEIDKLIARQEKEIEEMELKQEHEIEKLNKRYDLDETDEETSSEEE